GAYGFLPEDWSRVCQEAGLPAFRAKQILHGLYIDRIPDWTHLTTLPSAVREYFIQNLPIDVLKEVKRTAVDADGVAKFLLEAEDGQRIETVWIPADGRVTQCISSQVGCDMHCAFCASGQLGCARSLSAAEIVAQVMVLTRTMGVAPNNIVVMGMGEPFMNYDAVLRALRILNCQQGLNIGARHITLSTCGIVPGIERLSKEGVQFELSVSLHAPNDTVRDTLMPVNHRWKIAQLLAACDAYTVATGRIITYEYTLVKDFNDRPAHAEELIRLLRHRKARVNLIPLSPVAEFKGQTPPNAVCLAFLDTLLKAGIHTTLRRSRGKQSDAACGQLRLRTIKERLHGNTKAD
ncbi:MAG: 23S rRNA (adenine(2503)-C(2))-methyltransferase RlmN, partial [Kiritimatiellia bacterium]